MTEEEREHRTAERKPRLELSITQVAASALATVVGAVLASKLGVYGTITGAAVMSVLVTAGGAVLQHLFHRTGDQLRDVAERTWQPGTKPAEPKKPRNWRAALIATLLTFAVAMSAITVFELVTQRPLSATVNGTSGSGTSLGGGHTGSHSTGAPTGSATTGTATTSTPATSGSSATPSSSPTAGSSSPSGSPSASASAKGGGSGDAATSTPSPTTTATP